MELALFDFELPDQLIAQRPPVRRSGGRLLYLDRARRRDLTMAHFPTLLDANDLLVFNDTKVVPARCIGRKLPGGGRFEVLLERLSGEGEALVQIGTSKAVRTGQAFDIGGVHGEVIAKEDGFFRVRFDTLDALGVFESHGHVPQPPYIARPDEDADRER
ncbi:MAG: tRNA preQ1(34) S-adenosylmethionine ribosyltransferase-isomerase QueA, partial [Proteobacteria bacterium]